MKNESIEDRLKRVANQQEDDAKAPIDRNQNMSLVAKAEASNNLDTYRPIVSTTLMKSSEHDGFGALSFRLQNWKARMGADKIRQETALAMLKDQTDAAKRESFAFWTAKSAEIAETMMTYLKEHLDNMEAVRMENSINSLTKAADIIDAKLKEIDQKDLMETVKDKLMKQAFDQYETTCARIKDESLMSKYKSKS